MRHKEEPQRTKPVQAVLTYSTVNERPDSPGFTDWRWKRGMGGERPQCGILDTIDPDRIEISL